MAPYRQGKNKRELSRMMYFLRRYLIYIIVLVVLVIGVVATMRIYDNSTSQEEKVEGTTVELVAADTNYLAMYEPNSYNALASSDEDVVYLNYAIFSSLFKLDNTLNIVPELVKEYSVNTEEGSVEISLIENAYFSDGSPLYAVDVQGTVDWIKQIGSSSPYFRYANKIDYIDVYDNYNFTVYFSNAGSAALDNLIFPIVSSVDYDKGQGFALGSGQYAYSGYEEGHSLKLIPNEYYFGTKATSPVEIMFIRNRSIIQGMISMDGVTGYISKDQSSDNTAIDKELKCTPVVSGELEFMGFNTDNPLLANSTMRRAISLAVDQKKVIEDNYGSDAVISDSLYYPGFLGADISDGIDFEPKTSSDLILELGLKDVDEDGILETEENKDLIFSLIVNKDNGSRRDAALSIAEDLEAIGIEVVISELSSGDFNSALESGNFDLYLAGMSVDKQFDLRELYTTYNYGGYEGERLLELTNELEKAHTDKEQSEVFRELKKELYNEMPYFGICYKYYYFISVSTLDSKGTPLFFSPYENLGAWSWQKKASSGSVS